MSPEQLVLLLFAAAFWTLMVTLLDDRHRKSLQVYSGALGGWRHLPWWNCRLAYVGGAGEGIRMGNRYCRICSDLRFSIRDARRRGELPPKSSN
jgi:hypothetical protein